MSELDPELAMGSVESTAESGTYFWMFRSKYIITKLVNSCNQIQLRASLIFSLTTLTTACVKLPRWKCYKTIGSCVSCAFIQIWGTWEVWKTLQKQELLLAMPRATLTHLSFSPNFPRASNHDERVKWRMNQLLNDHDNDSDYALLKTIYSGSLRFTFVSQSPSFQFTIYQWCLVRSRITWTASFFLVTSRVYKRGIFQNYLFSVSSTAIQSTQNTLLKMPINCLYKISEIVPVLTVSSS